MSKNLNDYIGLYNINNTKICNEIVNNNINMQWQKHCYHNVITSTSKTYEDDLEVSYDSGIHMEYLTNKVERCIEDYLINVIPNSFKIQEFTNIRFNKYDVGTNMKYHSDHIHSIFDGQKKGIPILSILGLLNEDFEGGDFLMFDNKKTNLSTGDIIIFPSNFLYPHAVTTVTKGCRYSFVSWAY